MKDNIIPNGKWEFDEEVTNAFDEMLERSIPNYSTMRDLVFRIGCNYVKDGTDIIDMGCSNANAVYPFIRRFERRNKYKLIEVSKPMLKRCYERFGALEADGNLNILEYDLKNGLKENWKNGASLILSILTLQFTPIEYRHKIVKSVYDTLVPGGAFILVEKVLGSTSEIDEMFVKEYYNIKSENLYTQEQIQSKRKSLEGVLVPITESWNVELLKSVGFTKIDCFWRYLNFCGIIAIK